MVTTSVTQALAELKLLDKRLKKGMESSNFGAVVSTKTRPVDADKNKRVAESFYQSYTDLLARREAIKRAIVQSNAITKVTIGGNEYTIAEAIELKNSISYKEDLLKSLRLALTTARAQYERELADTNTRLDRLLASELGKDVRTNPETITALTNSFRENNKVELHDPLNLAEKVVALESEIETFRTNVDWILSEANGKTQITY